MKKEKTIKRKQTRETYKPPLIGKLKRACEQMVASQVLTINHNNAETVFRR
jgi:hypothetical protein